MLDSELSPTEIEFLPHHIPAIKPGNYRLDLKQDVTAVTLETFSFSQTFGIRGERFKLNPQDILSVFPPPDSSGDHANVLPHVILQRSTLPWERKAYKADDQAGDPHPWLVILLFQADEAPQPQVIALKQLYEQTTVSFPIADLPREPDDQDDEQVTIIDVPSELLNQIVPSSEALPYLAHVRRTVDDTDPAQTVERSVVIGNRLGRRGATSVAHLVSIERRYASQGFCFEGQKPVRLVSLKSWRYDCLDESSYLVTERSLTQLRQAGMSKAELDALRPLLNQEVVGQAALLEQAGPGFAGDLTKQQLLLQAAQYKKLGFKSLLMELDRGVVSLPDSPLQADQLPATTAIAQAYLQRSYVPLAHWLRNGQPTISWYHGPFVSGETTISLPVPVRRADALLQYDPTYGLLDVSYAAAWELGRLLALQSKRFSLALYQWKRSRALWLKNAASRPAHLPLSQSNGQIPEPPDLVRDWLYNLSLCQGVPFNYLVADERMLPRESIRFFQMDRTWIACLLDGALGVGRVISSDQDYEASLYEDFDPLTKLARSTKTGQMLPAGPLTGFLLRSQVVAGWPDLQVDAFATAIDSSDSRPTQSPPGIPILRLDRLSSNVLLCIFAGEAKTVDIHQKPEGIHFGLSDPDLIHPTYYKRKRNPRTGYELTGKAALVTPAISEKNRIDIGQLQKDLAADTSALFALQMIEGVSRVRFVIG